MASRNSFLDSPSFRKIVTRTQREAISTRRRRSGFRGGSGGRSIRRISKREASLAEVQRALSRTGVKLSEADVKNVLAGKQVSQETLSKIQQQDLKNLQSRLSATGTRLSSQDINQLLEGRGITRETAKTISQAEQVSAARKQLQSQKERGFTASFAGKEVTVSQALGEKIQSQQQEREREQSVTNLLERRSPLLTSKSTLEGVSERIQLEQEETQRRTERRRSGILGDIESFATGIKERGVGGQLIGATIEERTGRTREGGIVGISESITRRQAAETEAFAQELITKPTNELVIRGSLSAAATAALGPVARPAKKVFRRARRIIPRTTLGLAGAGATGLAGATAFEFREAGSIGRAGPEIIGGLAGPSIVRAAGTGLTRTAAFEQSIPFRLDTSLTRTGGRVRATGAGLDVTRAGSIRTGDLSRTLPRSPAISQEQILRGVPAETQFGTAAQEFIRGRPQTQLRFGLSAESPISRFRQLEAEGLRSSISSRVRGDLPAFSAGVQPEQQTLFSTSNVVRDVFDRPIRTRAAARRAGLLPEVPNALRTPTQRRQARFFGEEADILQSEIQERAFRSTLDRPQTRLGEFGLSIPRRTTVAPTQPASTGLSQQRLFFDPTGVSSLISRKPLFSVPSPRTTQFSILGRTRSPARRVASRGRSALGFSSVLGAATSLLPSKASASSLRLGQKPDTAVGLSLSQTPALDTGSLFRQTPASDTASLSFTGGTGDFVGGSSPVGRTPRGPSSSAPKRPARIIPKVPALDLDFDSKPLVDTKKRSKKDTKQSFQFRSSLVGIQLGQKQKTKKAKGFKGIEIRGI